AFGGAPRERSQPQRGPADGSGHGRRVPTSCPGVPMTAYFSGPTPRRRPLSDLPPRVRAGLAVLVTLALALALTAVPLYAAHAAGSAAAACGTTDISLNQPTTASSLENGNQFPAAAAT